MPRFRTQPEDFRVEEIPLETPLGEGPHTWIEIEKRLRSTAEVARELAVVLGLERREIGWAGRKDHVAVTRQWLSIPDLDPERALALELEGVRVLRAERHPRRLRTGALQCNRFDIVVREVEMEMGEAILARLPELARRGLPNRFGDQRFGRAGDNVAQGLEILRSTRLRGDRRQAFFLVSAVQAEVFNRVLALRPHDVLLRGDLHLEHAGGGLFSTPDPDALSSRLDAFEISPTGPIFGTKMRSPRGEPGEIERAAMVDVGVPEIDSRTLPRGLRLFGDRRALRIRPAALSGHWTDTPGALELRFDLPPGCYATVVLAELFPGGLDEGARPADPAATSGGGPR